MTGKTSRYERQLPLIGKSGQAKLAKSRIAIIGCGGLGSVASQYLAMAGIGFLRLVDSDNIEASNLNRQFYYPSEIGKPKASCLKKRLSLLNPETRIEAVKAKLSEKNSKFLIRDCDAVLDCLDNMESRLILSDACQSLRKLLIHGSVEGFSGRQITLLPGSGYLRKIYGSKEPKPGKIQALGPAAGLISSLQALESIKVITGSGIPNQKLLVFDGKRNRMEYLGIR